jgi:formylglycine-generating enzyme required for sulfatase activity
MASPGYSPPEQYGVGSQPGPWSDFYALGAMMYRAVTGKVPADSLRRLRNDPLIPAIQIAGKSYSKALLRAIDHMMQIDEHNRPASVAEIRAVLAPLSPLFGPVVREVRSPPAARAPAQVEARKLSPKIPLPMIAGGGLVLVLGLAGAVFFLTRSPEAERPRDEPILLPAEPPVALPPPPAVKAGLVPGTFFRDCPTCPELVVLPPGQFKMGADDGFPSEAPAHEVAIPAAIAIGRDPVTFAEWDACVADGGCAYRPGDQGWGRETRPVINVSWNDAQAYLGWLSKTTNQHYRLPSEAEWEYATRAGTTTAYWWDDDPGEGHAICADCSSLKPVSTEPVASLPPNPFGLYGMAGNVAQWVQDCWTESYTDAVASSGACKTRVLRGGSFKSDARYVRVSARTRQDADFRYYANGFRVARDGG